MRQLKAALLCSVLFFGVSVSATPVDGKIFYKLPSGELTERRVTLEVPSRGQGEVVLSGANFEWRTTQFKTVVKNGKTSFIAAFKTSFMSFKSTMILKGSYLRGSNKILYYGDLYKRDGHKSSELSITNAQYQGGFKFSFDR